MGQNQREQQLQSGDVAHRNNATRRVEISCYVDPLCCWSWALEKPLSALRVQYRGIVEVRYLMYAMITDWSHFNDPLNCVNGPAQMGPVWMHASAVTGVQMKDEIWYTDPPSSSVPAALAVKCAALQSKEAGELYLRVVRDALMTRGLNIDNVSVLTRLARELGDSNADVFDGKAFEQQLKGPRPLEALKKDMDEAVVNRVGRFPTLIMKSGEHPPVMVIGYRPYEILEEALLGALRDTLK